MRCHHRWMLSVTPYAMFPRVQEPIALRLISDSVERTAASHLWQLYIHDLSEFRGSMPDNDGLYGVRRFLTFFEDPDRSGYLIYSGSALAGLALISGLNAERRRMGEFFILRAARRKSVGYGAVMKLFSLHPGPWEIPFQEENPRAARFWRRIANDVAGSTYSEERRTIPGKPWLPPDTWLFVKV